MNQFPIKVECEVNNKISQCANDRNIKMFRFKLLYVARSESQLEHSGLYRRRLEATLLPSNGAYLCLDTASNCVIYKTDMARTLLTSSVCMYCFNFSFAVIVLKPNGFTCVVCLHLQKLKVGKFYSQSRFHIS